MCSPRPPRTARAIEETVSHEARFRSQRCTTCCARPARSHRPRPVAAAVRRRRRIRSRRRPTAGPNYSGPPPATADIQAFRINFWENVRGTNRCGNCHNAGGQTPQFARSDDVNAAYQQAGGVVNRDNPSQSIIVAKVGGGHNCWLADAGACASIMTRWIQDWVGAAGTGGRAIELVEPTPKDPGSRRRLPADCADCRTSPTARSRSTYTLLTTYCADCHRSTAATKQSPFFAAADVQESYLAAIPKINLDDPANSRFVIRLGSESHNCWSDCAANAAEMQAAIQMMADAIPLDAGRSEPDHQQGADAVRRHDRQRRQPLREQPDRAVRVQDAARARPRSTPAASIRRRISRSAATSPGSAAGASTSARRQGAGLDDREPQVPAADHCDRRVLDRSVGRAGQRDAGRRAHRQLLRQHDGPQLHDGPDDVQLRLLRPQHRDRCERHAAAVDGRRRRAAAGFAAARRDDVRSGQRPPHLRERRVHRRPRRRRRRHARRLGQQLRLRARQRSQQQPPVDGRDPPGRDPQPRAEPAADPAELRGRRRREVLHAVRHLAPHERAEGVHHVRGASSTTARATCSPTRSSSASTPPRCRAASRSRACASA